MNRAQSRRGILALAALLPAFALTLVTLVASIVPALRATRVPPISAVREGSTASASGPQRGPATESVRAPDFESSPALTISLIGVTSRGY